MQRKRHTEEQIVRIPGDAAAPSPVRVADLAKPALRALLRERGIHLNAAAEELFAHPAFVPQRQVRVYDVVACSVAALGFPTGAHYAALTARARELGYCECPLELGPYLRLQYLQQPEAEDAAPGAPPGAPPGSLTVASAPLDDAVETPKGFYLRRSDGVLWLRGYRADGEHVWSPADVLVFAVAGGAAR